MTALLRIGVEIGAHLCLPSTKRLWIMPKLISVSFTRITCKSEKLNSHWFITVCDQTGYLEYGLLGSIGGISRTMRIRSLQLPNCLMLFATRSTRFSTSYANSCSHHYQRLLLVPFPHIHSSFLSLPIVENRKMFVS